MQKLKYFLSLSAVILLANTSAPLLQAQEASDDAVEEVQSNEHESAEEQQTVVTDAFIQAYTDGLINYGLTHAQLDQLPADAVEQAVTLYVQNGGTMESLANDMAQQHQIFVEQLYPEVYDYDSNGELFTESEDARSAAPTPMTQEEAEQKTDEDGWYDTYLTNLYHYGISDQMLERLPEGAVRKAAINYLMALPTGGDPGVAYRHFITMYPEVFEEESDLEELTDEEREAKIAKSKEKQDKLTQHLQEADLEADASLESLTDDYHFTTDAGEFMIQTVGLVQAPEIEDEFTEEVTFGDHLVGIRYEYTHNDERPIYDPTSEWSDHVNINQAIDGQRVSLTTAAHPYLEVGADHQKEAIQQGQTVIETVYYHLEDLNDPLYLSLLEDDLVTSYDLNLDELEQLPYASALYFNDDDTKGYLFDYETLYLVAEDEETLATFDLVEQEPILTLSDLDESLEVNYHIKDHQLESMVAIALESVHYQIDAAGQFVIEDDHGQTLGRLTFDAAEQILDDQDESFYLIH